MGILLGVVVFLFDVLGVTVCTWGISYWRIARCTLGVASTVAGCTLRVLLKDIRVKRC